MEDNERFVDIKQLRDDYINYLDTKESVIAKIFVLDKYEILAYCDYTNEKIDIIPWQYGTEQEIVQNKLMLDIMVDDGYYDTTDEILAMHKVIIDREYAIRERIKMKEEC